MSVDEVVQEADLLLAEPPPAHLAVVAGEPGWRASQPGPVHLHTHSHSLDTVCVHLVDAGERAVVVGEVRGVVAALGQPVLLQVLSLVQLHAVHTERVLFWDNNVVDRHCYTSIIVDTLR